MVIKCTAVSVPSLLSVEWKVKNSSLKTKQGAWAMEDDTNEAFLYVFSDGPGILFRVVTTFAAPAVFDAGSFSDICTWICRTPVCNIMMSPSFSLPHVVLFFRSAAVHMHSNCNVLHLKHGAPCSRMLMGVQRGLIVAGIQCIRRRSAEHTTWI